VTEGLEKLSKTEKVPAFIGRWRRKGDGGKRARTVWANASSADPNGDRGGKPLSPITAAVLLCSFFSLLRKMN